MAFCNNPGAAVQFDFTLGVVNACTLTPECHAWRSNGDITLEISHLLLWEPMRIIGLKELIAALKHNVTAEFYVARSGECALVGFGFNPVCIESGGCLDYVGAGAELWKSVCLLCRQSGSWCPAQRFIVELRR